MTAARRMLALPLMLLALMLQGLSPAVAAVAAARMADPFANMPICSTDIGGKKDTPSTPDHGKACAFCVVCAAPALAPAPDVPQIAPISPARTLTTPLARKTAAPRAPPRRTAQARAPPAYS